MPDRLLGMQVFAKVAALGSLSAAARSMAMSQTMATKHLDALEARLGARLIQRTTRRLTLTEAGRRYLASTERILADLDEADALASAERVEVRGTLRVNAPLSFGVREIAPLIAEFLRLHPDVIVDLGLSDRYVDLIEEGWDLAIRIGRMRDSTLIARRIAPCRLRLAAAPSYLAARGTPRIIADLPAHNCLVYTLARSQAPSRWHFGADGRVSVAVTGDFRAENGEALVAAAIGGLGLVYEPTFLTGAAIRDGRLVAIDLDETPIELAGIYAVHASGRHPPAKVRAFIDFLAARLGPQPPWDQGI